MTITKEQKENAIRIRGLILTTAVNLELTANDILASLVIPKNESGDTSSEMLLDAFILRHLPLKKKLDLAREGLISIGLFDQIKDVFNDLTNTFIPTRNKAAHSMHWYGKDQVGFGGFEFERESGRVFIKKARLSVADWESFCSHYEKQIDELRTIIPKTKSVVIKHDDR